jgi:X-X-X-Leu-X-X-Gly heptad repeat protein
MATYATVQRVDLLELRVEARLDKIDSEIVTIKENVNALISTGSALLHGQERLEVRVKRLEKGQQRLEAKVSQLDTKVDQLDTKVDQLDTKVGQLDTKVDGLDANVGQLDNWVRANMRAVMDHLGVPEVEPAAGPDQT